MPSQPPQRRPRTATSLLVLAALGLLLPPMALAGLPGEPGTPDAPEVPEVPPAPEPEPPVGWTQAVPVVVDHTAGTQDLSHYQVRVVFDSAEPIAQGTMLPDCADVRFWDPLSAAFLPHWLEAGCGSEASEAWVRVADLEAHKVRVVLLLHGNPLAVDASDAAATFDLFDGFDGDALDTATWANPTAGVAITEVRDGELRIEARCMTCSWNGPGIGHNKVVSRQAFGPGVAAEFRTVWEHYPNDRGKGAWSGLIGDAETATGTWTADNRGYAIATISEARGSYSNIPMDSRFASLGPAASQGTHFDQSNAYRQGFKVYTTAVTPEASVLLVDGEERIRHAAAVPSQALHGTMKVHAWQGDSWIHYWMAQRVDWFRVRQYAEPEPMAHVGVPGILDLLGVAPPEVPEA